MIAGLSEPVSHYVHAVRFGDLLFISGMGPADAHGTLVGDDDISAQTRQTLSNIKLVLDQFGATFADVLKVTVFVLDIRDREAINVVRQEFFGPSKPASTLIEVSAFVRPGMKIEIETIAGLPSAG
jgi:2-iminobutanoate/2-iminopropanoate deaminase